VRARAIASLGATKDPSLANLYVEHLSDESYATIRESARALGQTKSPAAYDALVKLIDVPSWRESIKVSALTGLAALGDSRALDLGFRYASTGNPAGVRGAALMLLAAAGHDDPRVYPLVSEAFRQAATFRGATIRQAGEALVSLGDKRALELFEQLRKQYNTDPILLGFINNYDRQLRRNLEQPSPSKPAGQ
jgi:aminopeptidase N